MSDACSYVVFRTCMYVEYFENMAHSLSAASSADRWMAVVHSCVLVIVVCIDKVSSPAKI